MASCGANNGQPAADILADRITEMLRAAGMPTTLRECGVSDTILRLLAEETSEVLQLRRNIKRNEHEKPA